MGLKSYQQAWLALLLNQDRRVNWLSGRERFHGLDKQSAENLAHIDPQILETIVRESHSQRLLTLVQSLSEPMRCLLGQKHTEAVALRFLETEPLLPLYPRECSQTALLNQILDYLSEEHLLIPHLKDLLAYELSIVQLRFFSLPRVHAYRPGPVLASWASVLVLGHHFPTVLEALSQNRTVPERSESPRQHFLLLRDFRGLKLEVLHPILARCLRACDGRKIWSEIVQDVLAEESETEGLLETDALQAWLTQYLKRGILRVVAEPKSTA